MSDIQRGKSWKHIFKKHGIIPKGKGGSKLTEKQVIEIRKLYKTGKYTHLEIAENYNMSNLAIAQCINKRTWKNKGVI